MTTTHQLPATNQPTNGLVPYAPAQAPATPELNFTERQIALIKQQIAPDVNEGELGLFLEVCRSTGLNPLFRQIYAIVRSKDDPKNRKMTIQTGIDGYRLLAARTGTLAGIDDAEFDIDPSESWHPAAARVTVWRFVQGHRVPFTATARWSEYAQKNVKGDYTGMWTRSKMPFAQLAKCAEALALRKACPAELSGIYTGDEMGQADNPPIEYVDATPEPQRPTQNPQPQQQRQAAAPQRPTKTAPWKALSDPDVLKALNGMEIRGREASQAFLGTVKASMEARGLAWTHDQVLAELREYEVEEASSGEVGEQWEVTPAGDHDLATLDTGAPSN